MVTTFKLKIQNTETVNLQRKQLPLRNRIFSFSYNDGTEVENIGEAKKLSGFFSIRLSWSYLSPEKKKKKSGIWGLNVVITFQIK